jgi:hypothetical protein
VQRILKGRWKGNDTESKPFCMSLNERQKKYKEIQEDIEEFYFLGYTSV